MTLTGPRGERLSTPTVLDHITTSRQGLALGVTSSKTTYFIVVHPVAGRWTLAPEPGTSTPVRYEVANPLLPLRLRVHVTDSGSRRLLRWRLNAQRGIGIRFLQTGATEQTITQTTRGNGHARFAVAAGPAGVRHVVALVSIDGIPREMVKVARFRAPAPALPHVAHAGYRLRSGELTVSWPRVRHASFYDVRIRLSTEAPTYRILGSAGGASFEVGNHVKVRKVTVTVSVAGLTGNPVTARAPAAKRPKRHRGR